MPRTLTALLAGVLLAVAASAADEPIPYKIILPSGEAHELLPKTCGVCHKDSPYQFVVVAAPTQEGIDRALEALRRRGLPATVAAAERPRNLHASTACLFCHIEEPQKGAPAEGMQFRTVTGETTALADVAQLCEMCHPGSATKHAKVTGWGDAAPALAQAGLPVREGKVLCSTCHEMHSQEVGPASTRPPYLAFVTSSRQSYPHGNRAACISCHPRDLPEGAAPVFTDSDPVRRCVRCHEEDHGRIHPVGVAPSEKTFPLSFLDYPLTPDGKLGCSTCHDHPCAKKPAAGPGFLRGGPYLSFTDFCYRCHPKAGKAGLNPHTQIDEKGNVLTATCTFCHKTAPTSDAYDPEELLYLRSPVELCIKCHDQGPHPSVNHLVEMDPARAKKLEEYEKRHNVSLPLDAAGRVVCTTCHNPHGKGVLRGEAALGAGETHRWRVPSYAELCTPCHARYD